MAQFKRWLVTILSLLGIIVLLGFIKFTQIKEAIAFGESFPEPSETVVTMTVEQGTWRPKMKVMGEIKAQRSVDLRNEFEGIITKLSLPSGGSVNQGDVLIQLDIAPELAQLEAINAQIELAQLDVKRFTDLVDLRASSRDQLDRANSQLLVDKARAKALQASINRKTITAPFSGTTSIHDWEIGTFIAQNSVVTTLVGDLSKVWVDFAVPQWQANISLNSEVAIIAPNESGLSYNATVSAVNQQIASASRSVVARALLDNTATRLKPGSAVNVMFPIDEYQTVYPIANEALRFDTFGSYVFKLEKDDNNDWRAKRQPVTFVARELNKAMVTSGIQSGDIIATVGAAKLSEGLLVYAAQAQ